ncbi:MAG: thioredoxin-disulfide reductase [Proteobacteria bacterium]|nr:thioredoxin-disulfide reductase [Pseudomonadota bacterium]
MSEHLHSEVLILGSGPAGLTAAIYAARGGLKPHMISGLQPGGQMTITTDVENYPGFAEVIQGPWLMEEMEKQARSVGATASADTIVSADLSRRPFTLLGDTGDRHTADALIIATGASARWLGLESEERFKGFGVSACATCDGFFFRDLAVCVVGGGNTAVEEAMYLTRHASKVSLIHRRDALRAEKILQERLLADPKIEVIWDSVLDRIEGEDDPPRVTEVRIKNVKSGEESGIPVEGVFIAIGHDPNTEVFKGQIDMDADGYIVTAPDSTITNIPGVFAAGDVQDKIFRQAVTAAGTGCMSALEAEKYLADEQAASARPAAE